MGFHPILSLNLPKYVWKPYFEGGSEWLRLGQIHWCTLSYSCQEIDSVIIELVWILLCAILLFIYILANLFKAKIIFERLLRQITKKFNFLLLT